MEQIPSNYFMPFSKLKEYVSEWFYAVGETDELSGENKTRRVHQIINLTDNGAPVFSHEYSVREKFGDDTIVGTNEITDRVLSMMINQIVGFDIAQGQFVVIDECGQPVSAASKK